MVTPPVPVLGVMAMEFIEIETSREQALSFVQKMATMNYFNFTAKKEEDRARPEFSTERFMRRSGWLDSGVEAKVEPSQDYEALLGMPDKGVIRVRPKPNSDETMKLMIQVRVTVSVAEKFIEDMKSQNYEACEDDISEGFRSYFFKLDGETTAFYSVFFDERNEDESYALIGIRPI